MKLIARLDGSKPREITSNLSFRKWSRYKRLRLRTQSERPWGTSVEDVEIDTKKLIEALDSYEECKSFN